MKSGIIAVSLALCVLLLTAGQVDASERKKWRSKRHKPERVAQKATENTNKGKSGMGAFESRFGRGTTQWGINGGFGYTIDLPKTNFGAPDRTNIDFLYLFPHFKYNLTGVIGDSFYRGALYWVAEAGLLFSVSDSTRMIRNPLTGTATLTTTDTAPAVQFGFVPVQVEYKFLGPTRRWAPTVIVGAGFSYGDFDDGAIEISTDFEFILNIGGGIEYFLEDNKSVSVGYRLYHLSNSGIEKPNIGLNAHLFTVGYSF